MRKDIAVFHNFSLKNIQYMARNIGGKYGTNTKHCIGVRCGL